MLAEAREAVETVRQARAVLERLRDVRIRVMGAWQQMDDLPDGAAEDLRRRVAEAVTSWAADAELIMKPAWQVKVETSMSVDTASLEMALPVIWQKED